MSRSFTHVLTIYVTEAQHAEVARRAESRRIAMSDVVREAIDSHIKPRKPRKGGKNCPFLTPDQVAQIHTRRAAGETLRSIAADLNVSHVSIIKRLRTSPAEAALDGEERGDSPPSTPPALPSVASAGEPLTRQQVCGLLAEGRRGRAEIDARIAEMHRPAASDVEKAKAAHPWRRGRAVSARRVPGGRVE